MKYDTIIVGTGSGQGVPEGYDTWTSWGNDKWSYQELLPYFRMTETDTDFAGDFHGPDGQTEILTD